jgi:hypothetical protein
MFVQEGPKAFYKGILPRVMRVAPGQAIVFTVVSSKRSDYEGYSSPLAIVLKWFIPSSRQIGTTV